MLLVLRLDSYARFGRRRRRIQSGRRARRQRTADADAADATTNTAAGRRRRLRDHTILRLLGTHYGTLLSLRERTSSGDIQREIKSSTHYDRRFSSIN